jgi:hypothetical protein
MIRHIVITVIVLLCAVNTALAQSQPSALLDVRVYNVADLLGPTRDYPASSGFIPPTQIKVLTVVPGPQGKMVKAPSVQTESVAAPTGIEPLIVLIRMTIAPTSWAPFGGAPGEANASGGAAHIEPYGTGLVISQTPENHDQISNLLTQIRHELGTPRMTTVRFHWLLLKADNLKTITKSGSNELDPTIIDKLPPDSHFRGQITCFSGQTTHLISGTGRTFITEADPVVGTQTNAFAVQSVLVQSGLTVQFTPTLSTDGLTVLLDLHSSLSNAPAPTTSPSTINWPGIDRLQATGQQLSTTVRLPVNHLSLIGGMTLQPTPDATDERVLYLAAEVMPVSESAKAK